MSFKNMKRDDHGHVIGNDEVDGQKCKHVAGSGSETGSKELDNQLDNERYRAAEKYAEEQAAFDDDYEEEFNEPDEAKGPYNEVDFNWVKDHIEDNPDINGKELVEHVKEKFGDINPEDEQKIKELVNNKEFSLEDAINMADDDVLDEQFGKDTPERKLAGAIKKPQRSFKDMQVLRFMYGTDKSDEELMNKSDEELQEARDYRDYSFINLLPDEKAAKLEKENEAFNRGETVWDRKRGFPWKKTKMASGILYEGPKGQRVMEDYEEPTPDNTPAEFSKLKAVMPNGKEMSLFDFAHNITNYLDTDTAAYIIASKFGVSENDAKAYLKSPYNTEGSKKDYEDRLNKSRK